VLESRLLRLIADRSRNLGPLVVVGPGDDCAALRAAPDPTLPANLLVTVDQLIEGRHFTRDTALDAIARKAVVRSVSDIAAMAGTPVWSLATGALPPSMPDADADALFHAMHETARSFNCPLVGGDLASLPAGAPMLLTVTIAGTPHPTRGPVLRSTARVGDAIFVTGRIGGSFTSGRHLTFEPMHLQAFALASALGPKLHSMIDISDGLGRDAGRIGEASGVCLRIVASEIPLHADAAPRGPLACAADGEDYQLLFTALDDGSCPAQLRGGVRVTKIGRVEHRGDSAPACVIIDDAGHTHDASALGWDHA
jgi:thiamine-monophosphate kinase